MSSSATAQARTEPTGRADVVWCAACGCSEAADVATDVDDVVCGGRRDGDDDRRLHGL